MSAIILTEKIWGYLAYFFRNAENVPGNEKKKGNAITKKYKIIAHRNILISKSQMISQLIIHHDIIRTNFVAYCMQIR